MFSKDIGENTQTYIMNYNFTDLKTDYAKWMRKYGEQQQNSCQQYDQQQ